MSIKKFRQILFNSFLIIIFFYLENAFSQNKISNVNIASSNLPLVFINTDGQTIKDQERITAQMGIIDNGNGVRNNISDEFNNYNGLIAIELRGSSSSAYPKPQYRIETQDSLGDNLNVSLCGLPTENDWILYGPYNDKSLLRNVLSYKLSNQLGRYASRTVYCELFVNYEYLGIYVLMEKIKRDNDRVDISKLTELDNSGDELTGGYLVKIDRIEWNSVGYWYSNFGTPYQHEYPKDDEITPQQKEYIINYFNDFEQLMNSDNYNDPETGYRNVIDIDSFVDHFLLNEFCKNVDAYRLSAYMYKDKDSVNNKLIAGPIWDFNLTFGDAWITGEIGFSDGWQIDYSVLHPDDPFKVPFWWKKLLKDNEFSSKVKTRWNELRNNILDHNTLFKVIDSTASYIQEARLRNFQRWPEILSSTYEDEILQLKGWILKRLMWMDTNIDLLTQIDQTENNNIPNNFIVYQNYPNPFNPVTTIKYRIPSSTVLLNSFQHQSNSEIPEKDRAYNVNVQIKIYDMLGREIKTLLNEQQRPGIYEIEWDATNYPSGIYFYKITAGNIFDIKKMMLLK
ncbi:MAG: CotH kinase family protein [Ignavibacteriales bacterium]|nr:CotH kinase family protein [Ignavibacteriales bacterium]MCB9210679.1 CotH kinase family protein [Ignavibacteriales bacterium]